MPDSDQGVAGREKVIGVLDAIHAEGAQAEGSSEEAAYAKGYIGGVPVQPGHPSRHVLLFTNTTGHVLPTGGATHLHGMICNSCQ